MNARLPEGITLAGVRAIDEWVSLMAQTGVVEYRVSAPGAMILAMAKSLAAGVEFVKRTGKAEKRFQFSEVVHSHEAADHSAVVLRMYAGSEQSVRADDAVRLLAGIEGPIPVDVRIVKTAQYRKTESGLELII
jgi:hypothetical protein